MKSDEALITELYLGVLARTPTASERQRAERHLRSVGNRQEAIHREAAMLRVEGNAGSVRVIAGELDGRKGPARTFSPVHLYDVRLNGATVADNAPLFSDSSTDSIPLVARVREETSIRSVTLAERDVAPVEEASLQAQAQKLLARSRDLPAAAVAAEVVMSAGKLSFAEAVAKERAHFLALRGSEPARALRYLFFAEREQPFTPTQAVAPRPLERVSVIGAGTMGSGIALCVLQAGHTVDLLELNAAALEAGVKRIAQELEGDIERGRMTAERRDEMLARLRPTQDIQALAGTELVIEAIIEDLDIKRALFADLAGLVGEDTLLATNTSYLDIDRIAEDVANPERVLGLHFFSPAQRMALLEVVRCKTTSEQTLSTAITFSRRVKKKAIVVANRWGFVGNRLYAAYRRQCEFMLEEGASPERIDAALEAYGFAMGPFRVADMSGLDIAWRMRQQTMATRHLRRYVGIPDRICEAGRLGRKTGKGYYRYGEDKRPVADPEVAGIVARYRQEQGIEARTFSDEEIQQRAVLALINEALLLLGRKGARPARPVRVLVRLPIDFKLTKR